MRRPVPAVLAQHVADAAVLRNTRSLLVRAPHVRLHQLARLDERLAAHLDGIAVAGDVGARLVQAALENPQSAEVFVAGVGAIEGRDPAALERLFALVEALPGSRAGLASAFGWVQGASLRGITQKLLQSPGVLQRQMGLSACGMHGVDPGDAFLDAALRDGSPALRATGLRVAAQMGKVEWLGRCVAAIDDEDAGCSAEAARAATLLGNRGRALTALQHALLTAGPQQQGALDLLLKIGPPADTRAVIGTLAEDATMARPLIRGIGVAGDPHFLPWLVRRMSDPSFARLAGESFSAITGADLARDDLESDAPPDFVSRPSDDPEDDDTSMDGDDGLPWPDAEKVADWLERHGHRFATGTRCWMGEVPTRAHALGVLHHGFQRQRSAAATYLCLLQPGTPLFNTAAPAGRQQAWLRAMAP
ncbi:MAG: TIGR02270 family protein [Comamonadaceae bacterium]|nr:MAG: TIGR02270 family protein [Comamonadaceae bacterium]